MNRKFSYPPLTTRTLYHSRMLTNDIARRILRKRVLAPLPRRRMLASKVNSIVRPHQTHFKNEIQNESNHRDKLLGRENVSRMPPCSTENKRQLYNTGSGHRELKRPLSHSIHVFNERKSVLSVGQFKDDRKHHSITINTKDHRHSNPASPNIKLNSSARQIYRTSHIDSLRSNKALLRRRYLLTSHNRVHLNNRKNVSLRLPAATNKLNYLDDKNEIAENPSSSLSQKDKYSLTTGRSAFVILPINQNDENPHETAIYHKRSYISHRSGSQKSRNSAHAHRYSYNHGYSSNNEREGRYGKEISANSNATNSHVNQLIPSHRQALNSRAYLNRKAYVARRILRKTVLTLPLRKRILVPRVQSRVHLQQAQINDETHKHCAINYRNTLPRHEYISRLPLTSIEDERQQIKIHESESSEQLTTTAADYSFSTLTDDQRPHSFRSSENCRRQCKDIKPHISSSRPTTHASRRSITDSTFKPRTKSSHCTASTYSNTSETKNIIDSKSFNSPTIDDISEAVNLTLMPPPQPFSPVKEARVVTKNSQLTPLRSNKMSNKNEMLAITDKQEISNSRNLKPFVSQIHNLRSIPPRFKQRNDKNRSDRIEYDTSESNLKSFERSKRAHDADASIKRDQFSSDLRQHAADRRLVKPIKNLMNPTAHRRHSSSHHLPSSSSIDHKSSASFNFSKQFRQNSDKYSNQKIPLDRRHHSNFHGIRSSLFAHSSNPSRKTLVDNHRNHHASEQRHSIANRIPYNPDNRQLSTINAQRQMFAGNRQLQVGHSNRSASNMESKFNDLLSRYGRRKPNHFDCRFKGRR
ncbi:hypothetical protein GJ496_010408 [Pomphorhynchus laevis]|nr:hypothetical protein GJ496_010408 [Pomphorhynchus laevis]